MGGVNKMRLGRILAVLAVAAAVAPASAQWSGNGNPNPVEQSPAAKKHAARKPVARAAAKKPEVTAPKPAEVKPATKTEEAKASPAAQEPVKKKDEAKAAPSLAPSPELANISPADRLKIQSALFWSGDYATAAKDGGAMEDAIRSFQKRNKAKVTGVLTSEQRTELLGAANSHEQEFGWNVVVDPATGIRIGLPTKLVPNAQNAERGTRWSSPHGEVQVETFHVKNANLQMLFDEEKKKPNRTIERAALADDGFIVSGMQGLKYYIVRAKQRDGEVRGFTLYYDQMMEGIVAPVMVAMASAFSPFPERQVPFAALAKTVEYGTGLVVSAQGHIVTAQRVAQGCDIIVADGLGNAERVAVDEESGLALLRVYGARKLKVLPLAREAAKAGEITLVGIPDPQEQNGAKALTEIKGKLSDSAAIAFARSVPTAGLGGAAALDAKGQFTGIMATSSFALASAEPTLPPVRLISAATIRDFLDKQHVPAAATANGDARASLVRIICVRQ